MATQTRYSSKDAFMGKQIGGSFSGWNGKDDHLPIGASVSETYKWRSVVYFNIDFSPMISITSATLYLYDHSTGTNLHSNQTNPASTIYVSRMTSDWGEGSTDPGEGNITSTLTWDWDNRYDKYTTSGQMSKSVTQGSNGDQEGFDVTDIVTAWFNGSNNYGFMLRNNNESDSGKGVQYYSREKGGDDRPKLVIEYVTNVAPTAPTLTTPVNQSVTTSLTPTLSGEANDADAGDYVTGVQIVVSKPDNLSRMTYSSTTSAGDPGSGNFRLNNASLGSATAMYISETDKNGNSIASKLTGISGKYVRVNFDDDSYRQYLIGTVTDNGAYVTLALSSASGSGTAVNGDVVLIEIDSSSDATTDTTTMWSSGSIEITGSPTTFSQLYGNVGTPVPLVGNSYYKWRAKTKDKAGEWSTSWSAWAYFKANTAPNVPTVVVVSSPSSDIRDDTPDFSITHNDNDPGDTKMYGYQAVIEKETSPGSGSWTTTGGWDSGQVDTSGAPITTTTVTSASLDWGGSYRVKARTKDSNAAWSSYSTWVTFAIHETGVPISLAPSGGEGVSTTPTVTGTRASSADTIVSYQIIFYDDALAQIKDTGTLTSGITSGSSFSYTYAPTPNLDAGDTYYYKARVTGSIGGTSDYSDLQSFVVVDATTPTITSPAGTGITDLTPDIVITRASVFNALQIEVYPESSTSSNLGTVIQASGTKVDADGDTVITGAGPTTGTWTYSGASLSFATTYKMRARVSADGGSNWSSWSGLSAFTTDMAGTPSLTSVGGESQTGVPIIIDATPDFVITRSGSDTIDQMRVRVLNSAGTVEIWDSGMTDVANATTGTLTYSGSSLVPGTTYQWTASYQKTSGASGPEATPESFRLNSPPNIPSGIFPTSDYVFADTDDILFVATFSDPDSSSFGDTPTDWEIVVQEEDETPVDIQTITTGLLVGSNEYIWAGAALSTGVDYRWQSRFRDSNNEWGQYSSWNSFRIASAPNGTFTSPSSGFPTPNNVNTVTPEVTWSYSGGTQLSYSIDIDETDSSGVWLRNVTTLNRTTADASRVIPAGYFKNDKYYKLTLTVRSTDLLYDPSPSEVLIYVVLDAPDPITGLSPTADEDLSKISLNWDTMTLKTGHSFEAYYVYRRIVGDEQWQLIGTVDSRTDSNYDDWYAGHALPYQYRVNAVTRKAGVGVDLESGDDPDGGNQAQATLDADVWVIVGADRSDEHIQEIPVESEEHNRPVQQEAFETIGSDRKVIVRGFVLGHEGRLSAIWDDRQVQSETDEQVYYNNTIIGRRMLDYITSNKGPHILKSPFGDVWDVEFSGPTYRWMQAGHLEVDLEWIETGTTSAVSV